MDQSSIPAGTLTTNNVWTIARPRPDDELDGTRTLTAYTSCIIVTQSSAIIRNRPHPRCPHRHLFQVPTAPASCRPSRATIPPHQQAVDVQKRGETYLPGNPTMFPTARPPLPACAVK